MIIAILGFGLAVAAGLFVWFFVVVEKQRKETKTKQAEEINDVHRRYHSMFDDGWEDGQEALREEHEREILRKYNEGWNTAVNRYLPEDVARHHFRKPDDPISKPQI